jgi:RNA recognition motif-containing protein
MMHQPPPSSAGAAAPSDQQYISAQQYLMQQQQQSGAQDSGSSGEIKSLWIGDLQQWMDENYLVGLFNTAGEVLSAKVIRNKQSGLPEGYGFIEFVSHAAAEKNLATYNMTPMPNAEQPFRLNWASYGSGERRSEDGPDYTVFVGDLAADVTDFMLQETFRQHFPSVRGAKVVTDRATGRTKGYGFVKFTDENEQVRAMTEMNGAYCSSRPMRIGPAANKKPTVGGGQQFQKASYQNNQGVQGESDPNNTTIFVGGLDPSITEEHLKSLFGHYGELVHVKIPAGKRCGFVQFTNRMNAEQALSVLNGSQLGGQSIRLSWGRSPNNKQGQDQAQWNGGGGAAGYYPFTQGGYEAYPSYAQPPQDPNMYYGGYPGYANYQQAGAYQQGGGYQQPGGGYQQQQH